MRLSEHLSLVHRCHNGNVCAKSSSVCVCVAARITESFQLTQVHCHESLEVLHRVESERMSEQVCFVTAQAEPLARSDLDRADGLGIGNGSGELRERDEDHVEEADERVFNHLTKL